MGISDFLSMLSIFGEFYQIHGHVNKHTDT